MTTRYVIRGESHQNPKENTQDNARIWKALFPTDPKYVKAIPSRPGMPANRFSSIDPMWQFMRLTEYFGPIGQGWGIKKEEHELVDTGDELSLYVKLTCFYVDPETKSKHTVLGFGGDTIHKRKTGPIQSANDEALKRCVTDALGNAYMRLGLTADVRLNMHRDSKYIANVRELYENQRAMEHQLEEEPLKIAQS